MATAINQAEQTSEYPPPPQRIKIPEFRSLRLEPKLPIQGVCGELLFCFI